VKKKGMYGQDLRLWMSPPDEFEQVHSEVHGDKKFVMLRNTNPIIAQKGGLYMKIEVYASR
jgi:hypothetical protein